MVNNVGKTTRILNTNLGSTNTFESNSSITIIAGELGLGCLLFDEEGTLGVISNYTSNTNFIVTTYALSIDIPTILSISY